MKQKINWISVKDRLPEFDKNVLVYNVEKKEYETYDIAHLNYITENSKGKTPDFVNDSYDSIDVTHWAELEPPQK